MIKMVIVMRTDLGMRKGKMVSQGSHAAVNAILQQGSILHHDTTGIFIPLTPELTEWVGGTDYADDLLNGIYTKITVGINSEDELLELCKKADIMNINYNIVTDLGHTEFHGIPTITCCAIGPANSDDINKITGHLKLL